MKDLKYYNNQCWINMLENDTLEDIAELAYEKHKEAYKNDCDYIGNHIPPNPNTDLIEFGIDNFFGGGNGYARKNIPRGAENSVVKAGNIADSDPLNEYVRQYLNLKDSFCRYAIQEPGKCVSVHVDYNRKFFSTKKDKLKNLPASDVKKYVWFLEDQQIGQMWAIGRNNISWKAGDIFQWNWYVPHATANSSNYDRNLLIIIGY